MVVDASVWVSALLPDDAHHAASRVWLVRQSSSTTLVVPALALPEVAGAIGRRTGLAARGEVALRRMTGVPGLRIVALDEALALSAARTAAQLRPRGADAVYVAVAQAHGLPLVTLDDELHDHAGGRAQLVRP
jgi:predicted nucleic acid-binding protein